MQPCHIKQFYAYSFANKDDEALYLTLSHTLTEHNRLLELRRQVNKSLDKFFIDIRVIRELGQYSDKYANTITELEVQFKQDIMTIDGLNDKVHDSTVELYNLLKHLSPNHIRYDNDYIQDHIEAVLDGRIGISGDNRCAWCNAIFCMDRYYCAERVFETGQDNSCDDVYDDPIDIRYVKKKILIR